MNYIDGRRVQLLDRVLLYAEWPATIVAIIPEGEFSSEYPREKWEYLKEGLLLHDDKVGIVHFTDPIEDLTKID